MDSLLLTHKDADRGSLWHELLGPQQGGEEPGSGPGLLGLELEARDLCVKQWWHPSILCCQGPVVVSFATEGETWQGQP